MGLARHYVLPVYLPDQLSAVRSATKTGDGVAMQAVLLLNQLVTMFKGVIVQTLRGGRAVAARNDVVFAERLDKVRWATNRRTVHAPQGQVADVDAPLLVAPLLVRGGKVSYWLVAGLDVARKT